MESFRKHENITYLFILTLKLSYMDWLAHTFYLILDRSKVMSTSSTRKIGTIPIKLLKLLYICATNFMA